MNARLNGDSLLRHHLMKLTEQLTNQLPQTPRAALVACLHIAAARGQVTQEAKRELELTALARKHIKQEVKNATAD